MKTVYGYTPAFLITDDVDAATSAELATIPDAQLTVSANPEDLKALVDLLDAAIACGELPLNFIRNLCGPSPAALPAHMLYKINLGLGMLRDCRDTLKAGFRAANAAERLSTKTTP